MYVIVNERPSIIDIPVCSPLLRTWEEALCALADLRSETGNDCLHIYETTPVEPDKYEDITVGFDADLWEWFTGPELDIFWCPLRDAHIVDIHALIDEEEA